MRSESEKNMKIEHLSFLKMKIFLRSILLQSIAMNPHGSNEYITYKNSNYVEFNFGSSMTRMDTD